MSNTKRPTRIIRTTIGELASAFYEAAVAELRDPQAAALVARQMVRQAVRQHRVVLT